MELEHTLAALDALDLMIARDRQSAPAFAATGAPCAQPGELWLSTGATFLNNGLGQVTFVIGGPLGSHMYTFASGTTQANIVEAINDHQGLLGLSAGQDLIDTARVRLTAINPGVLQFVCARQQTPTANGLIFDSAQSIDGQMQLCDPGTPGVLGDLDCDQQVNASDIALVLKAWGTSYAGADLNGSGTVDMADLSIVLGAWT